MGFFRRICRIPFQSGNTNYSVILIIVGFKLLIVYGSVISDTIQTFHFKIGGMKTRKMCTEVYSTASHGIVVVYLHG